MIVRSWIREQNVRRYLLRVANTRFELLSVDVGKLKPRYLRKIDKPLYWGLPIELIEEGTIHVILDSTTLH